MGRKRLKPQNEEQQDLVQVYYYSPMIPNAEASCLRPCALYLLAEYLFPLSSMISISLISISEYTPISSTPSSGEEGDGSVRSSFRRRQHVPSLVDPTTYNHWVLDYR